ncbi:MAG TPA: HEAT repeat domain-containing protein [Polyangiaceae bacterium LLY-WYZ-14_1]|nr:HEAT repeat domain-containing protein [Polyangiaceae bacterium LLY-WYZ-14_1]
MRPTHLPFLFLVPLLGATLLASPVDAQRRRGRVDAEIAALRPKLESGDPAQMKEGIQGLFALDNPAVIPVLAELLRSGAPDDVTDEALFVLSELAHRDAMDVLVEFTNHRRDEARKRAYEAIARIDHPARRGTLEECLSDSDRDIRGTCAFALGEIGAKASLDVLFRAFERGVVEAAISIGKLGDERHIDRFDEYLEQQPLPIMLDGYNEFLSRNDIKKKRKEKVVTDLGEISGPLVRRFLFDYLNTFSENDESELRQAVEETIRRIPDDPSVAGERIPSGGN